MHPPRSRRSCVDLEGGANSAAHFELVPSNEHSGEGASWCPKKAVKGSPSFRGWESSFLTRSGAPSRSRVGKLRCLVTRGPEGAPCGSGAVVLHS
jgi:hypothetical protein